MTTNLAELARAVDEAAPIPCLPSPAERRRIREAAGLPVERMASLVGVAGFSLRRWEEGKSIPRLVNDLAYRRALAVCGSLAA